MSATNNRRSIPEILGAMKTALEATQWNGSPAFSRVELFDTNSLQEAIRRLLAFDKTLCFLVPLEERFEPITEARKRIFRRKLPIAVLISDRALDSRQKALFGSYDNPGAYGLLELALPAIIGQLISHPNAVVCTPAHAGVVDIIDTEKKLPGRAALELDVECTGGTLETTLALGPTI